MALNRRRFLEIASAASAGALLNRTGLISAASEVPSPSGGREFVDRISFAPWMNDVRTEPLPFQGWPPDVFDDITVSSLAETLKMNAEWGYNYFDIYGLFATWGWPVNLADAATPERVRRVKQVLSVAHNVGIKVVYGLGVYSWGFDEIIKHNPEVAGPNIHAMCASKEASWDWQQKLIDFILQYDLDGFHLESADLGRCTCEQCMARWPHQAAYHNYITSRTAQYIRSVRPDAYVCVTLISWADWNVGFTEEDKDALVELSKSVDCIVDQGHRSCYLKEAERKPFIERLHCRYGTSGGFWTYPTYVWDRLQWFLPYPRQTGTHMKALYDDGGRGVMYYQGPPNNPSAEINIAFGGQFMRNVDKSVEENLAQVLERLYKPKNPAALEKLAKVVLDAEEAYMGSMDWDETRTYLKGNKALPSLFGLIPGPGELHLSRPITGLNGTPDYILEPQLTHEGRKNYNLKLEQCLKDAQSLDGQFEAQAKLTNLQVALLNNLVMLRTAISTVDWMGQQDKARQANK